MLLPSLHSCAQDFLHDVSIYDKYEFKLNLYVIYMCMSIFFEKLYKYMNTDILMKNIYIYIYYICILYCIKKYCCNIH